MCIPALGRVAVNSEMISDFEFLLQFDQHPVKNVDCYASVTCMRHHDTQNMTMTDHCFEHCQWVEYLLCNFVQTPDVTHHTISFHLVKILSKCTDHLSAGWSGSRD